MFTYLMLGQKTSYKALGCCGLIIAGFFLGIDQENALGKKLFTVVDIMGGSTNENFSLLSQQNRTFILRSVRKTICGSC
jgi:GDP-fucose transporter C1